MFDVCRYSMITCKPLLNCFLLLRAFSCFTNILWTANKIRILTRQQNTTSFCFTVDHPIPIPLNTMRIGVTIIYFEESLIEISKLWCIHVPFGCFFTLTDNVEPSEMPPQTAFHLNYCLQRYPFTGFQYTKGLAHMQRLKLQVIMSRNFHTHRSPMELWGKDTRAFDYFTGLDKQKKISVKLYIFSYPSILTYGFGCLKEPPNWDGSFEYPQHMFWLRNKKIKFS